MTKSVVLTLVAAALTISGLPLSAGQVQAPAPAGQVAQPATAAPNETAGEDERVKADDIDELLKDGKVFLLDVREPKELEELGTLDGYVNIPLGQLEKRLGELPKDKAILTA